MLKHLVLVAALGLGGCATIAGGGGFDPKPISDDIAKAQALATQICGFVPTINTVAQLIPVLGSITAVAQAICNVVAHPAATRGGWRVAGVPVKGRFVRPQRAQL